jgi:hypothetical protein
MINIRIVCIENHYKIRQNKISLIYALAKIPKRGGGVGFGLADSKK